MLLLAVSLLFTDPAPLEMPRAAGYRVTENGRSSLEDRYLRSDLWLSETVDGRWMDEDGRVFVLASLHTEPPSEIAADSYVTRVDYERSRIVPDKKNLDRRRETIASFAPFELPEKPLKPETPPRHYCQVEYWQGTNESAIVCACLPKGTNLWRLAVWNLAKGDDFAEALESFNEEMFPRKIAKSLPCELPTALARKGASERELFVRDARHSVSAYPDWHVTEIPEEVIIDNLSGRETVSAITNLLPKLRKSFAETLQLRANLDRNVCVARIFSSREEYLDALAADGHTNMSWSAAYWSPSRRELVAYDSPDREDFICTFRHESLHQYLTYATAMITVSPWLNEGYAQYFEKDEPENPFADWTPDQVEQLSRSLTALMMTDYEGFYEGTDEERRLKYRLALSVAYFIEKGAPKVRFEPFKDFKRTYFETLFKSRDMTEATLAALGNEKLTNLFIVEWVKFGKAR